MKRFVLLIFVVLSIANSNALDYSSYNTLSTRQKRAINTLSSIDATPQYTYVKEVHGNNIVVFSMLPNGNVKEYVLVQGVSKTFGDDIKDIMFSADKKSVTFKLSDDSMITFSINNSEDGVIGIAHGVCTNPGGIQRSKILQTDIAAIGSADPASADCDSNCLSGGCGASSCSHKILKLECNVTCNSGYFACCADISLEKGCHCVPDNCCNTKKSHSK